MRRKAGAIFLHLAVLVTVLSSFVGCSDANDQFIQGSWYYRDPHLDSVQGETFFEASGTFDRGTFEFYTCCFSGQSHQTGRYRFLKSVDDRLVLELFNIRGGETAGPLEVGLRIDTDGDALTIQASGPFTRTLSSLRSGK